MERAVETADRDWESRSTVRLVIGYLGTDAPLLGRHSVFYVRSLGCILSEEKIAFARAHNARIDELVERHGVPDWSPRARLPGRAAAVAGLEGGEPFDNLLPSDLKEDLFLGPVVRSWLPARPLVFRRLPDPGLLLLGGDLNPRASRVDVLDLLRGGWMARYEFLRRHEPRMPWDGA